MAVHQCEKWQLREHPKGGMYCAACGMRQGDTMNIHEEAVEAAAAAWEWSCEQGKAGPGYRDAWSAALEAAAPLLMAQALREMAETFDPLDTDPIKSWHPHDVAELLRWRASDITA